MYRMMVLKSGLTGLKANKAEVIRDMRFEIEVRPLVCMSAASFAQAAPDLLLLDLCAHKQAGLDLLKEIRLMGVKTEVITYIMPDDRQTLRSVLRLGVLDCLVDPFDTDRFEQAVERFLRRKSLLSQQDSLDQEKIDQLLRGVDCDAPELPKGLQKRTLNSIRAVFNSRPYERLSCGDIVDSVNLSRITVQRYLEYLSSNHEVIENLDYNTGGRPCALYQYNMRLYA